MPAPFVHFFIISNLYLQGGTPRSGNTDQPRALPWVSVGKKGMRPVRATPSVINLSIDISHRIQCYIIGEIANTPL